jgi:hypothetical protein
VQQVYPTNTLQISPVSFGKGKAKRAKLAVLPYITTRDSPATIGNQKEQHIQPIRKKEKVKHTTECLTILFFLGRHLKLS